MSIQNVCVLISCFRCSSVVVDHPGRSEEEITPMCEKHSHTALEAFDEAEVVEDE